jgi:hypothetical protein
MVPSPKLQFHAVGELMEVSVNWMVSGAGFCARGEEFGEEECSMLAGLGVEGEGREYIRLLVIGECEPIERLEIVTDVVLR